MLFLFWLHIPKLCNRFENNVDFGNVNINPEDDKKGDRVWINVSLYLTIARCATMCETFGLHLCLLETNSFSDIICWCKCVLWWIAIVWRMFNMAFSLVVINTFIRGAVAFWCLHRIEVKSGNLIDEIHYVRQH